MAQNLTQPSPYEDEIDLKEIFKILIESKKINNLNYINFYNSRHYLFFFSKTFI
jgi:hypothetical protein